jgi:hypothetical protein
MTRFAERPLSPVAGIKRAWNCSKQAAADGQKQNFGQTKIHNQDATITAQINCAIWR